MTKIDLASLRVYAVLDGERLAALWAEIERLQSLCESLADNVERLAKENAGLVADLNNSLPERWR